MSCGVSDNHKHGGGEVAKNSTSWKGWLNIMRVLLDAGVGIKRRDPDMLRRLCSRRSTGRTEVISLLLERGVNPHATNWQGRNALKHCAFHQW